MPEKTKKAQNNYSKLYLLSCTKSISSLAPLLICDFLPPFYFYHSYFLLFFTHAFPITSSPFSINNFLISITQFSTLSKFFLKILIPIMLFLLPCEFLISSSDSLVLFFSKSFLPTTRGKHSTKWGTLFISHLESVSDWSSNVSNPNYCTF